jgi:hypothetical protein
MIKIQNRKSKATQYVIGGTVAVIILGVWISFPLMSGSSMDSSSAGNPVHSKVADISSLGSDIPSEGSAPGTPLNGEMVNNPATSGEDVASSLFQSASDPEDAAKADASADANSAAAPGPSASGGVPAPSASGPMPGGKLAAVASITAGNSNSMTAGGAHSKFFGTGNEKANFAPAAGADMKKMAANDKKGPSLASLLSSASDKSQAAAKAGNMDASKGGAAAAFGGGSGGKDLNDLNSGLEGKSFASGLQLGQTAQDLKKNDPSLNKHKVTLPEVTPQKDDDAAKQMKQMMMQMLMQMVMKVIMGGFGM